MTLIQRHTTGGLVVAELASDEAAVSASLKAIDDRLVLWPPDGMNAYYRVARQWSDDHDATVIKTWRDPVTGDPLPLSSGIIDEVDKLRLDGRYRAPDVDEHNAQHVEKIRKLQNDNGGAITDDHRAKIERGRTTVSVGARSSKPYWQRNSHLPDTVRR